MKNGILLVTLIALSGCSSLAVSDKPHKESRSSKDKYISCDTGFFHRNPNGTRYSVRYQEMAKKSWPFALMSSNSYEGVPLFFIEGWYLKDRYSSGKGFSADIYERRDSNKNIIEIAAAFRGTNVLSPSDWVFGNFNIYWEGQYAEARELIKKIRSKRQYKNLPIIATGHSLGGGLSLHVSLYFNNVDAYVFNTSPRVFAPSNSNIIPNNNRYIIGEDGEILNSIISKYPAISRRHITDSLDGFDFLKDNLSVVEHGMYYLARGLLYTAASYNDAKAIKALEQNVGCKL